METLNEHTPMREIEIFGVPALFTAENIPPDTEIPGMYVYELLSVRGGHPLIGTIFTLIPVEVPEDGERDVYEDDFVIGADSEYLTPLEFGDKYLSPEYDPDPDERYGKDE